MAMTALAALVALGAKASAAEPRPDEVADAANAKSPAVAVLYLDYSGEDEELAALRKGLAQMLVTDLSVNPKLKLVERLQLESVLQELELTTTRKIDRATAAKVGKLLGAKYLVMGGYFELVGTLRIDVRVVDVETGALVKGFGVNGKQDEFLALEQALVTGLDAILVSVSGLDPPAGGDRKGDTVDRTAARDEPPSVKRRPQAPPRLRTKTAARYGKALDLMDKGKKVEARAELEKVVAEEPGFGLAQNDLQKLVQ
jgi:TolB-like protein